MLHSYAWIPTKAGRLLVVHGRQGIVIFRAENAVDRSIPPQVGGEAIGIDITYGIFHTILALTITVDAGYRLTGFNLIEKGDYFKIGAGNEVAVPGQLRVQDLVNASANLSNSIAPVTPLNVTSTSFANLATTDWTALLSCSLVWAWFAKSLLLARGFFM